jgi:predicted kinase
MLIAMAGLPGTGKSTIARHLAAALHAVVLDKDRIRAAVFPPDEIDYSSGQDDFCMQLMLLAAEYVLSRDCERAVILDGRTFSRTRQLDTCAALATRLGVSFRVIECACSDETVRARLERDALQRSHPATNRDYNLYLEVKARFEPIAYPKLVVDTERSVDNCVQQCLVYLQ